MNPETIIAMDGSWSQERNVTHGVVDFIDHSMKKVLDYEMIEKFVKNLSSRSVTIFRRSRNHR
jgi:hypothetical protein